MEGSIDKYKLAWIDNNDKKLKSLFFSNVNDAYKKANEIDNFYYIMELDTINGKEYSWKLLPGEYNFYLFHWQKLMIAVYSIIIILLFFLLIFYFKK